MTAGFVIWSLVGISLLGVGLWAWNSEKPVGFYSGIKPSEVSDARKYNRAVAVIWFIYTALFELLGIPLLFIKQRPGAFIWSMLGTVIISAALPAVYHRVLEKYKKQ